MTVSEKQACEHTSVKLVGGVTICNECGETIHPSDIQPDIITGQIPVSRNHFFKDSDFDWGGRDSD